MSAQAAGKRNQIIHLQRCVRLVDANGLRSENWITYATVFAQAINKSDKETERAGTFGAISHAEWLFPFYPGILVVDRVNFNGRIFNIQGVNNVDELNRDIRLVCTEQT